MYDGTGAQVASLTYDAYGNTVSVTNPNGLYIPFRYRGYYFDEETGFYYLQSRYYDPETGRFINADDVGYLGESNYLNLFAYCGNNPVMFADPTGNWATEHYLFAPSKVAIQYYFNRMNLIGGDYTSEAQRRPISGQSVGVVASMPMGGIFGTVSEHGCGAVAMYNAMLLLDQPATLASVIFELDLNYAYTLLSNAWFGVASWAINAYFTEHGVNCQMFDDLKDLNKALSDRDIFIMLIWNDKNDIFEGQHYFTVQCFGNKLFVYNRYSNKDIIYCFGNMNDIIDEGEFIYAWIVG